jgi:hypothetical protein
LHSLNTVQVALGEAAIILIIKPHTALKPSSMLTKTVYAFDFLFTIRTQQAAT